MGEALIDLVYQYPALWDKQHTKYKDNNYKDARWKENAEILSVSKDDAIKKWKSLQDTHVRQKSIKVKSGAGLSDSKPRWKYYTIMSFLDVSLLKRRYAPISFKNRFYINSYKLFPLCSNSSKFVNNFWYQFFVVVLYLMCLMLGVQMAVMDEQVELAQEQEAATPDMEIGGETEDSQSSPGTSSRLTTPLPLTPVSRPTPGKRM